MVALVLPRDGKSADRIPLNCPDLAHSLTSLFTGAMWRPVLGCFIAAVASASYVLRANAASDASI